MHRQKVLLLGDIVHAKKEWLALSSHADLISPTASDRQSFINECQLSAFDGTAVIYRTYYSASITGLFDEELIQSLPSTVQFICHSGAGYDQIDVEACSRRGIQVSNVPSVVDDATADTAMFLMLGALRGFNHGMTSLRTSGWRGSHPIPLGHDPQGKILGILGCGGIGRNMAKKAAAFGMRVIYHNRTKSASVTEAEFVDFETLLKSSDVIALGLPLKSNTRHILSDAQFHAMKQGVVIINAARGALIDEEALVAALESGKVWSCGLDVFEHEPKVHPGLIAHPRAMLLPHLGTYTVETHEKMERRCLANVCSALVSGKLLDPVNFPVRERQ